MWNWEGIFRQAFLLIGSIAIGLMFGGIVGVAAFFLFFSIMPNPVHQLESQVSLLMAELMTTKDRLSDAESEVEELKSELENLKDAVEEHE